MSITGRAAHEHEHDGCQICDPKIDHKMLSSRSVYRSSYGCSCLEVARRERADRSSGSRRFSGAMTSDTPFGGGAGAGPA